MDHYDKEIHNKDKQQHSSLYINKALLKNIKLNLMKARFRSQGLREFENSKYFLSIIQKSYKV